MEKAVITNFEQLKRWFEERDVTKLAFDTETTSLNYYYLDCVGMSFSDGKAGCYIDLTLTGPMDNRMLDYICEMFKTRIKKIVMHNAPFDMKVLHKIGITEISHTIFDTMVASHVIDENRSCSLKNLAHDVLGVDTIVAFKDAHQYGYHSPQFYDYATNDAIWTWQLHAVFAPLIERYGMHRMFYEIEMPFQFVLLDFSVNGILLDLKRIDQIEVEMRDAIFDLEKQLLKACGKSHVEQMCLFGGSEFKCPINFGSNPQVERWVQEIAGITLPRTKKNKKTGLDNPKLDKFVFEEYKHVPFMELLWCYRTARDILNKFIVKMKSHVCGDGRVRCSFNDTGTTTGRLSSSDPNLQNLRKIKDILPVDCRSCFIASPGKTMISFDYSGQELRVLAHESRDPVMIRAFMEDQDLHLTTARMVFDLPINDDQLVNTHPDHDYLADEKYAKQRQIGKNGVNFPIVYGATSMRISRDNGVSEDVAQGWIDAYYDLYKGVKNRLSVCKGAIRNQRYVTNLVGRRRNFPHPFKETRWGRKLDPKVIRQGFNFLIQGFSAEMLRLACNKIRSDVILTHPEWGAVFLITVHDEVVFEVWDKYVDVFTEAVTPIMENCVQLKVPIKVGVGKGRNYSEAK